MKRLREAWLDKSLSGWRLVEYIDAGKSALVFKGQRAEHLGAVKVFDPEIVERFGGNDQADRINRELSLVGAHHENLVEILDGGYSGEHGLYFVVMQLLEAPTLERSLGCVPPERIRSIISQIAAAAEFLETRDLVHRDIKPSNVAVEPSFERAVLLDLGVIRPLDTENLPPLTDREGQVFVGTLQYSSPEFLLRRERQTKEGYRAITFYQLGAVLHDLLTGRPIFGESVAPYARLVQAVLHERARIDAAGKPADLVSLANNCLVKDPSLRLQLVGWEDFHRCRDVPSSGATAAIKERIRKARVRSLVEEVSAGSLEQERERKQALARVLESLSEHIRSECIQEQLAPPMIHSFPGETGQVATVCVHFKPARRHALLVDLCIGLKIQMLDVSEQAVSLSWASAIAPHEIGLESFEGHWQPLFEGLYEGAVATSAFNVVLYSSMERAMHATPPVQEVNWIDVSKEPGGDA